MRYSSLTLVGTSTLLLAGLSGCGSSQALWVTCEVAQGGKPYAVPDGQVLHVTFHAMEAKDETGKTVAGDPYAAALTSDGKYEVLGREGRGIPPGKYRIALAQTPKSTATAPRKSKKFAPDRDHDFLEDRYSPTRSPIILTVDRADHLVIDLDKWKVEIEKAAAVTNQSVSD